jgi:hypothetical protein
MSGRAFTVRKRSPIRADTGTAPRQLTPKASHGTVSAVHGKRVSPRDRSVVFYPMRCPAALPQVHRLARVASTHLRTVGCFRR